MKRFGIITMVILIISLFAIQAFASSYARPEGETYFQERSAARLPLTSISLDTEFNALGDFLNQQQGTWQSLYLDIRNYADILEAGDSGAKLSDWSLAGMNSTNTNNGVLYWNLTYSIGNTTVSIYKDSGKAVGNLVAQGIIAGASGTVTLTEVLASGISGSVVVTSAVTDTDSGNTLTVGKLKNAVAAIGATVTGLYIPSEVLVYTAVTVPANITLVFERGGSLNVSSGATVTVGTEPFAGNYPIFTGSGTKVPSYVGEVNTTHAWSLNSTSLNAMLSAIGSQHRVLTLGQGTWTISDVTTIPSNITLKVEHGAILTKSGSGSVIFNGSFDAGLYMVFSGFSAGDVTFGDSSVKEVYPQWWGALGDGVTDDTTAINSAISAASNGGVVRFSSNKVYLHSGIVCNKLDISFIGDSSGNKANADNFSTTLKYSGSTGDAFTIYNASYALRNINIKNIRFSGTTTGKIITANNVSHLHLNNVLVVNNTTGAGSGITLLDCFQVSMRDSIITKESSARSAGSYGLTITRSAYTVFGSYNFNNVSFSDWQYGVTVGNITAEDATGYISGINFIGCDWSGCGYGIQIGGGTNNTNLIGCYIEGCTAEGVSVYYDARNVTINGSLFNNPGAGVTAEIRLGKGATSDLSRNFYGVFITNNFFKNVSKIGVQIYGNTGARNVFVSNNRFVLGIAGAVGIATAGITTNPGIGTQDALSATILDNVFSGFASGNEVTLESNVKVIERSGLYQSNARLITQTGNIELAATSDKIQTFTSTSAAYNVKLPLATSAIGKEFIIQNSSASTRNVVVQTNGGVALTTLTPGQRCLTWNDGTTDFCTVLP